MNEPTTEDFMAKHIEALEAQLAQVQAERDAAHKEADDMVAEMIRLRGKHQVYRRNLGAYTRRTVAQSTSA